MVDTEDGSVYTSQPKRAVYSQAVGLVYIFNLIVGTGALTMPKAFLEAGWLIGIIAVTALAFVSYITTTFVIEAMACANALRRLPKLSSITTNPSERVVNVAQGGTAGIDREQEQDLINETSLIKDHSKEGSLFDITDTIEMGQMAEMFFNAAGRFIFYLCIVIYLFGDLAIYAAAVPKTLRDVSCTYIVTEGFDLNSTNISYNCNTTLQDSDPCWSSAKSLTRAGVYRIYLAVFFLLLGPFTFFNLQKTTLMQIATTLLRWLAFSMMIALTLIRLFRGEGEGRPPVAKPSELPTLFGVCVYSFMCHHSLPQMATPIRNKSRLYRLLAADYFLILLFYAALCFTATFAFDELQDLYTLNFRPIRKECETSLIHPPITTVLALRYFIALFPVFTLSSSFPIIAITLRGNLSVLISNIRFSKQDGNSEDDENDERKSLIGGKVENKSNHWVVDRILLPTVTLLIPFGVAMGTNNLQKLVGITGSYAGAAIQYFIPACFVLLGRRKICKDFCKLGYSAPVLEGPDSSIVIGRRNPFQERGIMRRSGEEAAPAWGADDIVPQGMGSGENEIISEKELLRKNEFLSPFSHVAWIIFVFVWAVVCVCLVTANHIINKK